MSTILHVTEHPSPDTLAKIECYDTATEPALAPGKVRRTPAEQKQWEAEQISGGWAPQVAPMPPASRSQETDIILQRLTPAESQALFTARQQNWQIDRLVTRATAAGAIRDDDPEFPTARDALDQLGIIAAARWPELLA